MLIRKDKLKVEEPLLEKLKAKKNIEIIYNTTVTSLNGEEKLSSLTIKKENKEEGGNK